MFLEFTDLYGNPVFVRPERVDALRGLIVTWDGQPKIATLIVTTNRETFRVRGSVAAVKDAIEAWHVSTAGRSVSPSDHQFTGSGGGHGYYR